MGVRFGPYQGGKVQKDIPKDDVDSSYIWEVVYCFYQINHFYYKLKLTIKKMQEIFFSQKNRTELYFSLNYAKNSKFPIFALTGKQKSSPRSKSEN